MRELVHQTGQFISFQCHSRYGDMHREGLKRQLLSLSARSGLNILLTPIGRIHSFHDEAFLKALAAELGGKARLLPPSATLYDVAYTVASSGLFCGTSLHGVITALSYGIPFVPLATEDPKLQNNVRSWGLSEAFPQAQAAELTDAGRRSLEVSSGFISEYSARLRGAALDNMRRLAEHILEG